MSEPWWIANGRGCAECPSPAAWCRACTAEADRDQLRSRVAELEREASRLSFYETTSAAEVIRERDSLAARCQAMGAVYEAAVEWSESFGELSKRLPPHVHRLREAVDAAQSAIDAISTTEPSQ